MEITFTCPHCGEVTLTDERFVGQSGPCRRCDAIVTVPNPFDVDSPFIERADIRGEPPLSRWGAYFGPVEESRDAEIEIMTAPFSTRLRHFCFIAAAALIVFLFFFLPDLLLTSESRGPARRMITQNGLKQIVLALQNYESEYGRLPRAYYRDTQGEILLPWRMAILPYVEEEPLFERCAKNEPWNSPTNYEVTSAKVKAYGHPGLGDERDSQTGYVAVTGPGSLFVEGQDKRLTGGKLPPNEMIVLVEVPESDIHWSEPVDVDLFVQFFRTRDDHPEERRFLWREGAEVAFADGSIRHLTAAELEKKLQSMFKSARPEDVAARFAALED